MASSARSGATALALLLLPAVSFAQSAAGGVLLTTADGRSWSAVAAGTVPVDRPLVALGEVPLRSPDGAVSLRLMGEVGDIGPLPALEAAVRLHAGKSADLELSL